MSEFDYKLIICQATRPEIKSEHKKCVMKHTVWARESKEDEKGDYIFEHPTGIDEITYGFENYIDMMTCDSDCRFYVYKTLISPE